VNKTECGRPQAKGSSSLLTLYFVSASAEQLFKAHKSLLAACSDFFHALFASEEIKQTPLSYIELQGITGAFCYSAINNLKVHFGHSLQRLIFK